MAETAGGGLDIGSEVVDSAGEKIGSVSDVVVRPPTLEITDVVVRTGAILGRDVVVPIDAIGGIDGRTVRLKIDRTAVDTLPDYIEVEYEQPPEDWMPMAGFAYPASNTLWPAGMYEPNPSKVTVNVPSGTVGLHEGMVVESSDGHKVGTIRTVVTDPASDDVTSIVIKHGFPFGHEVTLPGEAIGSIDDDRITLTLRRDQVEQRSARK